MYMNVPGEKELKYQVLWRKSALNFLGIVCPELILEMAAGQWLRARQCVRDFNKSAIEQCQIDIEKHNPQHIASENPPNDSCTKDKWNMKMAFFADMGGFRLRTKEQESFPIDARQLYYLISRGYIKQRFFKPRMLDDKKKVDGLLRTIILCQISWFLISVMGRWAQQLAVTTAELTTVSFILYSAVTAIFWWHKPADVVMAETIDFDINVHEILIREFQPLDQWRMTPLDFASREEWWWSRAWWNLLNILRKMHMSFGSEKPIDRIADSGQRVLPKREQYMILAISTICFAVFFIAWNHDFPTRTEMIFWRAVCVILISMLYVGLAISELVQAYFVFQGRGLQGPVTPRTGVLQTTNRAPRQYLKKLRRIGRQIDRALNEVRNKSPDKDPDLYIPLRVILPLYVMGFVYCFCRFYILIADAVELRSLPPSAYASVDWQKFWPHLG
ncbi:MAG: hypothetical protein Q9166_006020 [cf. Caloplaca sp. 2 TL-2023]